MRARLGGNKLSTDRKTEGLAQPGVEAQYFTALGEGKLMIQHCGECRRAVFYPRQFCPHCDSEKLAWVQASGRGTVHAVTIVRTKPQGPYNVSLIDLDEGVRMMSRVDGIPPDDVKIGMRVQANIIERLGNPLVVFVTLGEPV